MRSIYKGVSLGFLLNQWSKAVDKREIFSDKEKKALKAGHKLSAAGYRWMAGLWHKRAEKLMHIMCEQK